MMSFKVIVPLFVVISFVVFTAHAYSDCGSEVGSIENVEISGCDNEKRCILKRSTNVSITINFKTNEDATSISAIVHGVILGVPIRFDLPNGDGCKDSGVTCPIKPGEVYTYVASLPVKATYPRVTVDVKWELQNQDGKDIICLLVPSKLQ